MRDFLCFDDSTAPVISPEPDAVSGDSPGAASGLDYNQLIYEYLVSQDIISGTRLEEMYAAQSEQLENYKIQLEELRSVNEWIMSLLLLLVVLFLFRCVRRWVYKLTGGLNDVF